MDVNKKKFKGILCHFQVDGKYSLLELYAFETDHIEKWIETIKLDILTFEIVREWFEEEKLRQFCNEKKDSEGVVITISEQSI